ncbi:MAG: UDP-3-O-(3-hydroxymyristoyl)glucosamine N-acyltransferase [Acidobacteriota bacterium]
MKVREIAAMLGADWSGDGECEITGAAPIEEAGPADLSFVGNAKGAKAAETTAAGCLLVAPGSELGRTRIYVPQPRGAFARCLLALYPRRRAAAGVHPSAVLGEGVELGEGVSVGPQTTIGAGTKIGAGSEIGAGCAIGAGVTLGAQVLRHARVTIYDGVTIGARAVLHAGCVIGADGFGFVLHEGRYQKFPQVGRVEIGDDFELGANACIDRAALGVTRIGHGVKLDNMVHIAHNCQIGNHVVIAAQTGLSGGVVVEDYAIIGGQVGIGDKARIESKAVLGSGCGVLTSKIVHGNQVVWGTPARPLKEYLAQLANVARLGDLKAEVKELRVRVEELCKK